MSKVAHYLQDHLLGEVSASEEVRRHFATDQSIFTVAPSMVVYPRNEHDIRKTTRFVWQLAERGRVIPITPRGAGTDTSGAAIGEGIILSFTAHMHRIIELNLKNGDVIVEPGLNFGRLQQTLHTHERNVPSYPTSFEYSTVGGAAGNNAAGEKSYKYGGVGSYIKALRVVLANGEVIATKRLSKRELSKKLGLSTFEGEVYRSLDKLLEENKDLVHGLSKDIARNVSGYNLAEVKHRDGTFDLTPLFVGSQGTLGTITEITFETLEYNPETDMMAVLVADVTAATQIVTKLEESKLQPCSVDMVDANLLKFVRTLNPNALKETLQDHQPGAVVLIEFDETSERQRKKAIKQCQKIVSEYASKVITAHDPHEQSKLRKLRHASAVVMAHSEGRLKPLPIIDDGIVPLENLQTYIDKLTALFKSLQLHIALWGSVGDGVIHLQPFLDLEQIGDRQKIFRLLDAQQKLVSELGGSMTASRNDGRLRGPYLKAEHGEAAYSLFEQTKKIFDPHTFLNPGVKIGVTQDMVKPLLRNQYNLDRWYAHMPRS